jgi:hypothetical protein
MPEDLADKLERTVLAARRTIAQDRTFSEELRSEAEADREEEERKK